MRKGKDMSTTIYKTYGVVLKEEDDSSRSFWAVASTEEADRDGDVITASGWELENFRKNPVVLFAHKYDSPPIAKVLETRIGQGKLMFKLQFATRNEYPFADTIYKLYRGGFLRSFSVGFIPKDWEELRGMAKGRLFKQHELVEISAVPIPTNPKALAEAQRSGLINSRELKSLKNHLGPMATELALVNKLDSILEGVKGLSTRPMISPDEVTTIIEKTLEAGTCQPPYK
ncbi:MAG: HK97 family phage prohead protease [Candidatus Brocadiales bacterium]